MAELFDFKKVYYINGVLASFEDCFRLMQDSLNPRTNPIRSLLIHGNVFDIITY
jgi:hypothetical protein